MTDNLRSGLIRLAHSKPELRPHLLPLLAGQSKTAADLGALSQELDKAMKGLPTNAGAGWTMALIQQDLAEGKVPPRKRLFDAITSGTDFAARYFRQDWASAVRVLEKLRDKGLYKSASQVKQAEDKAPKDVLKESSDNYFVQFVAPLITKASMTAALKTVNWAPRGKGSLDKKSKGTHGLLDFTGTPHQSPLEFHLSGSYMTEGDGMASIFLKSIGKGTAEDRFKMTGDPAADAKKFVESIKDLCEEFNPKQGKTASDVGKIILDQMGGWRRISAMIGAKNAVYIANGVHFSWPSKQPSKGNSVKITLGGDDLYTMEFVYERNLTFKTVAKYTGVYADSLVDLFEKQTGYYLKF